MRLAVKLVVVLGVTSLMAVAAPIFSVTFTGPDYSPSENTSSFPTYENSCPPLAISNCIIGNNPIEFTPVSATITENSPGNWTYTETTYSPNSYGGQGAGAFGDALFYDTTTGTYWGLALDPTLDGLTGGDLYYAGTVYGVGVSNTTYLAPLAIGGTDPVLVSPTNPGAGVPAVAGTPVSVSSFTETPIACFNSANTPEPCSDISVDPNGYAEYSISDNFTLTGGYAFLGANNVFDFEVASYVCSNGVILGSAEVPEPRGVVFMGAGLVLLAGGIKRLRTKTA